MLAQRTVDNLASAELQAIDRALAVIVFSPEGTILRANANFLRLYGYTARELIGRPRSIFVPQGSAETELDAVRWKEARGGEFREEVIPRLRKDGSVIWVRAQYTPIADADGNVVEIVMFVTDVTEAKRRAADDSGQIIAINASQAVIHFALDGTILGANERFLETMGFGLDEVVGRHHRMFVDPVQAQGEEYLGFWKALAQGRHHAGVYRRLGRGGREVWLQATYNPIFDMNGQPFKVVKYATDITADKLRRLDQEARVAATGKSHAVITFDINGTVLDANQNFLEAVGYRLAEIEGRHHRMFVDPSFAHGPEYASFWNHLAEGLHQSGEYKRFGKNGREIWLHASYNPIQDLNGKVVKVVKYATVITREKLRQADHQGQIASIHKAQCVVSFELDGRIIDANDNFLDATGYRLTEVCGRPDRMFVDDAMAESAEYLSFWADLAQGRHKAGEFKRLCKDGREIWLQASYNPIFDMAGRPFKIVTYATDVTRERLHQQENEGQIAAIRKSQCVATFDMQGVILDANDNFLAAMGYERAEIEGRHHSMFVDPVHANSDEYRGFWDTLRAGNFLTDKFRRLGKGDKEVWIQASYNPILDLNGLPFKVIKIATDVTADVALAADFVDARRQALHDAATALPNRAALTQFMTAALGAPATGRLVVLYLDLDHFKPINDSFGHEVGDFVLRETARRLRGEIRPDQIVARVGGDEFVVAAANLSDERIEALCQRLIAVVQAPIQHDQCVLTVGLSIGVAVSPHDAATAEDLLRCADVALYRTKGNGRGSYSFFATETDEKLSADRHLAEEMRHGIQAGQFFLEYQPRFDARARRVHSVLAQVHWVHPAHGRLESAGFNALAEKSGLIVPLGEWILRTACHAAAGWADTGISVPVSPIQFAATDFPQVVETVLAESGLAPQRLELEVMERTLVDDAVRARKALGALKALGVRLMLADHGSHHTSLDGVRAFPFDALRIDRRFIADLEAEAGGRAIARDILRLGHALAVPVKEPGVETNGELLMLRLGDSAEVQGFLVAPAVPLQALSALLQRHERAREADDAATPRVEAAAR